MVMRDQDIGEPPAGGLERGFDRGGFRRINRRGRAASRIVQEHAVIVLEAEKQMDLGGHVVSLLVPALVSSQMRHDAIADRHGERKLAIHRRSYLGTPKASSQGR